MRLGVFSSNTSKFVWTLLGIVLLLAITASSVNALFIYTRPLTE